MIRRERAGARAAEEGAMTTPYTCPECGESLVLYANGDNGPADDQWTCDACGVEYPHDLFPLPSGYVKAARATEEAEALKARRESELWRLARWNEWASRTTTGGAG